MKDTDFKLLIWYIGICTIVLMVVVGNCINEVYKEVILLMPNNVYYEYNIIGCDTIPVDTVYIPNNSPSGK